jgi:hypothetical protein
MTDHVHPLLVHLLRPSEGLHTNGEPFLTIDAAVARRTEDLISEDPSPDHPFSSLR